MQMAFGESRNRVYHDLYQFICETGNRFPGLFLVT